MARPQKFSSARVEFVLGRLGADEPLLLLGIHRAPCCYLAHGRSNYIEVLSFLITYPRDQIRTLVFIFLFVTVTFIPAAVLVGLWFIIQVFSEIGALVDRQTSGVAFMSHVGGFLFGAVSARFFETRERRAAQGLKL